MKRFIYLLILTFIFSGFVQPANASVTYYKDARAFGKLVTQDLMYGTIYYRDKDQNYQKLSSGTFIKIQPKFNRDYQEVKDYVGNTVIAMGKMERSSGNAGPLLIYDNFKNVDYEINLTPEIYLSKINNYCEGYGLKLFNDIAMRDLLEVLISLPDAEELNDDLSDDFKQRIFNWKKENLKYQNFITKNNETKNEVRKNTGTVSFIQYQSGDNEKMAVDAEVTTNDIREFMSNGPGGYASPEYESGPLTMYGSFEEIDDTDLYYFIGTPGHTLKDWIDNFGTEDNEVVMWDVMPDCEEKIHCSMPEDIEFKKYWVSGSRYQDNETEKWYFRPTVYVSKVDFRQKLGTYEKIVHEELLR